MFNWFDLMRQAQGGAGFDNMARQFGLRPEQIQLAVAALVPAFAMGFQRQAANANAMTQLFQLMTAGQYPNFFDSAAQAFSSEARKEGQAIVDKLFGSDEVTRRVAQQAAQFSGVGTEVLNQLLPLVAAILAGGMYKVMAGQGAMLGSMMETWRSSTPAGGNPWAAFWANWPGMAAPAGEARQGPVGSNPFEAMMSAFLGRPVEQPAPEPEPPQAPEAPDAPRTPVEAWGQMLETGQEMQRKHLESLQSIFDSAWGRTSPRR
jgi:hypothetical protein